MLYRIDHETRLTYTDLVTETVFEARMAPPSNEDQSVLSHSLETHPHAPVLSYRDGFGNRVSLFNVSNAYSELVVHAKSLVRTHRRSGRDLLANVAWPVADAVTIDAFEYLRMSPLVDRCEALDSFVACLPRPEGVSLLKRIEILLEFVRHRLTYTKEVTGPRTRVSESLALGHGVCQDFTHLFLGTCRSLGLPARYVSGYVHHPGELATHSWCQIWAGPRVGWVDVDPTAGCFGGDDHIVVAVGRDYADVPPNRGVWKGRAEESISVLVKVERVERLPVEGADWSPPIVRPIAAMTPWGRSRPITNAALVAFPNQRPPKLGLHQQQAEQQQQAFAAQRACRTPRECAP